MGQYVKHKRSSVVSNGAPKLPTAEQLAVGEIAINFAEGYETLSILNNSGNVATFSSDEIIESKIPGEAQLLSSGFTKGSGLPAVTSADNDKVLKVVNGQWVAATPYTVYTGNNQPDNILGNNGDIFLQTS